MCYVWKYFINLQNKRTSNGFGMNPLSYSDIHAYFCLIQVQPEEWELETILKLDSIAMDQFAKDIEKQNKTKAPKKK